MIDEDDRGDWEHDVAKDKELDRRWEEEAQRQREADLAVVKFEASKQEDQE